MSFLNLRLSDYMAQFQNHELDDVVGDYYDMADFNNYPFEEIDSPMSVNMSPDSDSEDDFELDKQNTDTSAFEARNGKDVQGIPWERFNFTRDKYREMRCKEYKNYENLPCSREVLLKECKQRRGKEVLNVARPIVPALRYPGSCAQRLSRFQISTMVVKDNLLAAGGFQGELVCKYLNQSGVAFSTRVTAVENGITNAVDICQNPTGSMSVMTANNDAQVRVFDAANFACVSCFCFPWSVNNTSVSPDGRLLAVLGDSAECLIADAQSGKAIGNLRGHKDYSFSSAWHPDGRILATGNQDTTCRLWDIRNTSQSVSVLMGRMGTIRAIRFTSDGRFLAMAEPADFVHIFDTKCNYGREQEIDLFGEIAGISFSPDTEALFVGIADRTYGSLLEFNRRFYSYRYLDSIL